MQQENDERRIRGYAIISKGDQICEVEKNCYLIPSQSSNGKYKVCNSVKGWTCECPDFQKRHLACKHVFAIQLWLSIREKIEGETFEKKIDYAVRVCAYCDSNRIVKDGFRKTEIGKRQIYLCRECGRKFVYDIIKKSKGNGKLITLVLDLWFKGVSIRKIADHLKQFYDFDIGKSTIQRWITKVIKILDNYTELLEPQVSETIHLDEQMIKSKGEYVYCWNAIDKETRFLLASNVTEGREVKDAKEVVEQIKDTCPKTIITDRLMSYRPAIKQVFRKDMPVHVAYPSIRNRHVNNNKIERYHNTFRERDKVIRGFKSNKTAQTLVNGHRVYYNYIRPHTALGTTPSDKAGLWKLEGNKWMELMKLAEKRAKPEKKIKYAVKIDNGYRIITMEFDNKKRMNDWVELHQKAYPKWKFEILEK